LAVEPKITPISVGDGDVWEWFSPSTAGYGDPLRRQPAAVLGDVEARLLTADAAGRVFGVVIDDEGLDVAATAARRKDLLRDRLDGQEPADQVEPPEDAKRIGDLLHVVDGRWWCNGADLGPLTENYKLQARMREMSFAELSQEFIPPEYAAQMSAKMVFREYLCPVTGLRIDSEMARIGEPPLHDIVLPPATPPDRSQP
jgi:N-methylhydantoinase B